MTLKHDIVAQSGMQSSCP